MRECSTYRALLSARQDGALTPSEEEALRAHLAECPSCRNYASLLSAVTGAAGSAPAELADAVLKKTAAMPSPAVLRRRRLLHVLVPVGAAAAVAALVIGLWPTLAGRLMKGVPGADSAGEANVMTAGAGTFGAGMYFDEGTADCVEEAEPYDAACADDDDAALPTATPLEPQEGPPAAGMSGEAANDARNLSSELSALNLIFVEGELPEEVEPVMTRNAAAETLLFDGDAVFCPLTPEEARALLELGYASNFSPDLLEQPEETAQEAVETFWMEWTP